MTEISGHSFDAKRTVVLLNFPPDARKEELTIHFQKERNGGGDVDEIVLKEDGSVAFITFDFPEGLACSVRFNLFPLNLCTVNLDYQTWVFEYKPYKP